MIISPGSIRIFFEVGKRVAVKAKGLSALALATGLGAAAVAAASKVSCASRKAQNWVTTKFTE